MARRLVAKMRLRRQTRMMSRQRRRTDRCQQQATFALQPQQQLLRLARWPERLLQRGMGLRASKLRPWAVRRMPGLLLQLELQALAQALLPQAETVRASSAAAAAAQQERLHAPLAWLEPAAGAQQSQLVQLKAPVVAGGTPEEHQHQR